MAPSIWKTLRVEETSSAMSSATKRTYNAATPRKLRQILLMLIGANVQGIRIQINHHTSTDIAVPDEQHDLLCARNLLDQMKKTMRIECHTPWLEISGRKSKIMRRRGTAKNMHTIQAQKTSLYEDQSLSANA